MLLTPRWAQFYSSQSGVAYNEEDRCWTIDQPRQAARRILQPNKKNMSLLVRAGDDNRNSTKTKTHCAACTVHNKLSCDFAVLSLSSGPYHRPLFSAESFSKKKIRWFSFTVFMDQTCGVPLTWLPWCVLIVKFIQSKVDCGHPWEMKAVQNSWG